MSTQQTHLSSLTTPCLEWNGSLDTSGYGLIRVGKKLYKVHRWAYETKIGPIPEGMLVLHACDNRKCYEVSHLFLGTLQDNMRDRNNKNRQAKGEINRHKLTEEQIKTIKCRKHAPAQILAVEYGVNVSTIYAIRKGTIWAHVNDN